jgi:hypothetical protein
MKKRVLRLWIPASVLIVAGLAFPGFLTDLPMGRAEMGDVAFIQLALFSVGMLALLIELVGFSEPQTENLRLIGCGFWVIGVVILFLVVLNSMPP